MRIPILAAIALSLAACGQLDAGPVSGGSVALGESASLDGATVTPRRVVEDSRCPVDVNCVWAGRVVLSTLISIRSQIQTAELISGEPHRIGNDSITLVSVTPDTHSERQIAPEDYRFVFEFGKSQ